SHTVNAATSCAHMILINEIDAALLRDGDLLKDFFELLSAPCGSMIAKNTFERPTCNIAAFLLRNVGEEAKHLLRSLCQQNLPSGNKETLYARPVITDDRGGARRCLEKPDARRIANFGHGRTRQIESESLLRVKPTMLARGEMLDSVNIRRPLDHLGILRSGDHETVLFF